MPRGQLGLRNQSARRMLGRCRNSGKTEEAIIIDGDIENADVVLIDNTNTHHRIENSSTVSLNRMQRFAISIDDEEDDSRNSSIDSANSQVVETFSSLTLSDDSDSDDSLMFVGNDNVNSNYPGLSKNCYGLYSDLENSMAHSTKYDEAECEESESSSSDCELMEDLLGITREQWEKAASMKKESCRFNAPYQPTTMTSTVYPENVHESYADNYFERMPSKHAFSIGSNKTEARSSATDNDFFKTTVNKSVTQSTSKISSACKESDKGKKDNRLNLEECLQTAHSMNGSFNFLKGGQEHAKASLFPYERNAKTRFFEKKEPSARTFWPEKQFSFANSICPDRVEQKLDEVSYNAQSQQEMAAEGKLYYFEENAKVATEKFSPFYSRQQGDFSIKTQSMKLHEDMEAKSNKVDAIFEESAGGLYSRKLDDTSSFAYESVIGGREKHKETEEYKLVAKEEWASRQRQLQIQAEDAQRLRKRRKAENIRLLDTMKRQKQRLEEIRDLQKKGEETMQLKEHIRTEVRKNLKKVEMNCKDMASVLRSLGISVKGGLNPTVHEINVAYKQALLKFHPDRASRTDIHQQVEAEERFKLISRLKEELLH